MFYAYPRKEKMLIPYGTSRLTRYIKMLCGLFANTFTVKIKVNKLYARIFNFM